MEINPFLYFLDPNRRVYWLFLISSLIIGLIYLWLNPKTRKVNHSAKVLNPFTFYRVHPIENLLFGLRYSLTVGLVTGIFLYLFGARLGLIDITEVF